MARGQASAAKRSRASAQRASVSAETLTERAYRALEEEIVTLRLNRQQLELIDRTVARGVAPDRASLVRLALKEYAASRNQLKQRN